jgi:predicted metalloprotease
MRIESGEEAIMRLDDLPESGNVEDRRSGGGRLGPIGGGGLGIGAIIVLGLVGWALGIDPSLLIGGAEMLKQQQQQQRPPQAQQHRPGSPQDEMGRFVSRVLGSTEVVWTQLLGQDGKVSYRKPILVLYRGQTNASCGGVAQSNMGPFYCPADMKIYLDTSFFDQIARRFRSCDVGSKTCQFAQAYVIAHEVGHHVQNLLGILPKVQRMQQGMDKVEANQLQVRVELQADCLAGLWAHHSQQDWKFIEPGDVEAAMQTASAIGDDRLQRQSQGYVVPDAFTHGSSQQRVHWFMTGLRSGAIDSCDTFRGG